VKRREAMKQKQTKLMCDSCGGEVVYENRSEWDHHQAHQRLHKKDCEYKARCKVMLYKKDVTLPNGDIQHKAGDPYTLFLSDAEGAKHEVPYEYLPQWEVCAGIPLRTEMI
jgi:hypothetical protein